ncbi:hypothetical protein Tco_1541181 [Tanacetum coccineum]
MRLRLGPGQQATKAALVSFRTLGLRSVGVRTGKGRVCLGKQGCCRGCGCLWLTATTKPGAVGFGAKAGGTDIAKTSRKRSKPDKHGHWKGKRIQELGECYQRYPKDSPFDLVAYTDSDYAGASLNRKSTTRGCQFLRSRLISWQCKKQTIVANSITEAKYVAASSCCGQLLWMQNQLLNYG